MVEAQNPHKLHPTFISFVYKVSQYLDELWMGIWMHPNTVKLVQVEVDFKKNYLRPGSDDVVTSC